MKNRAVVLLLILVLAFVLARWALPTPDTGDVAADVPTSDQVQRQEVDEQVPNEALTNLLANARKATGYGEVACPVNSSLPFETQAVLLMAFEGADQSGQYASIQGWSNNENLTFDAPFQEGNTSVVLPAHERAELEWTASDDGVSCRWITPPVPAMALVIGSLADFDRGRVFIRGCGDRAVVLRGQSLFQLTTNQEECSLRACRKRGALEVCGNEVSLRLSMGEVREGVVLPVPEAAPAGIGIGLALHDRGIRVTMVHPNSPAESAGLVVGDVILSVDGQDAVDMDIQEFIRWGTGPEGSSVSMEVMDKSGEFHQYTLTREPIQAPGHP